MRNNGISREVYVIASEIGITKVGIADSTSHRLAQIRGSSPVAVELFNSLKMPYKLAKEVEARCHEELAKFRKHGEWFKIDPDTAWTCVQKHANAVMADKNIDHVERRRRENWLIQMLEHGGHTVK